MTREQIRNKTRVYIDEYNEEASWKNVELNHLIDMVYKKVSSFFLALDDSHYTTEDEFQLESGVEFYGLPDDFLRIKWIHDGDGNPITPLRQYALKNEYADMGRVCVYYLRKDEIGFMSIPTKTLTFPYEYVYAPANLVNDNSVPDVPEYLGHELIAAEVAAKALDMDEEVSPILLEEIKELKRQIIGVYYRRNVDFTPSVPGDPALDDLDG